MDEGDWIAASKAGDVQAFNRLVIAYQQIAYNFAFRMLRDEEAAADATQDAFIAAYTHLRDFRGGSFKAWLLRILLNRVYDQLRSLHRHPTESLETLSTEEDAPVLQIANGGPTPEEAALSRELMGCVEHGLRALPPDQRATLILSDVQGLSYEEIAVATGANLGTVKSRLSRARLAMRGYLEQYAELLPSSIRHYFDRSETVKAETPELAAEP